MRVRVSLRASAGASANPSGAGYSEMIAKLISAGYLQPEQRNNPDAIANAI